MSVVWGNESHSDGKKGKRRKELQALKSHIIESSGWAVVVSNHEFFNVVSPNGPLCPCSTLPGSLKIIEDLSECNEEGVSERVTVRDRGSRKKGE